MLVATNQAKWVTTNQAKLVPTNPNSEAKLVSTYFT